MKDLRKFVETMKQLKITYPNWQVNVDDPATVLVWFDWFDTNTYMNEDDFKELAKSYSKEKMYAPHSPRELFEIELDKNLKRHVPFAVIWREATRAFRFNEKQNQAFIDWVKVDCGHDDDAMKFLRSKELLYLLEEWIRQDDNDFVDRKMGEKAEQAWKAFLAKKVFKNAESVALPNKDDDVMKLLD